MLEFTLSAKHAKNLVKALENISEDAVFQFDSTGLHISVCDTFRNRLLESSLSADSFETYTCDSSLDLGIIVSRLRDVTKTLRAKESVSGSYSLDDPNFLIFNANGVTRRLRLVNTDLLKSPPPIVYEDYIYQATVESKRLQDFLKAASNFHTVEVAVNSSLVSFSSQEGEDEVSIRFTPEEVNLNLELTDALSTHGIIDLAKGLSTINDLVLIRGGPTIPISFSWSWGAGTSSTCYISRWE